MNKILKNAKTKLGNEIELIASSSSISHPALIIGVFHGDEPQGKYLIEKYLVTSPQPSPSRGEGETFSKFAQIKAKELRKCSTDAEKKLWEYLRANRFQELHFKRQQPIGKFIVDFVCFEHKLIIELDGGQHNVEKNVTEDLARTKFLENKGFKVLRFWNNEIFNNIEGVFKVLTDSLPPRGGGLGRGGLFIPCLNPDGMQLGRRTNANGVDLNRNFPTKNWGEDGSAAGSNKDDYFGGTAPASEIETQFLIDTIEEFKPSVILTLHAPYKVVNYDGPAKEIAEKISKIINYPVEASIGYPTPGSFGTYAGVEKQIPTITLELDETCSVDDLIKPVHEIFDELL